MRSGKSSFRHQSLHDQQSIQDVLKSISRGLSKGKITFSDEDDKIIMRPEGLLALKVTADQEDNRNRFTIRVSWQVESAGEKNNKSLAVK